MKKSALFLIILLYITGCNNPFDNTKLGVRCDNKNAIALAESIINDNILKNKAHIKIDTKNIVIWDYNPVGKYLCKAKITGTLKEEYLPWAASEYGIYKDKKEVSGWVYYETYLTTKELEKQKEKKSFSFYVEILRKNFTRW